MFGPKLTEGDRVRFRKTTEKMSNLTENFRKRR